jgi:hypothetical protein
MRSSRSNWSVFRVDCRPPGQYTRFGVTSGWTVTRPERGNSVRRSIRALAINTFVSRIHLVCSGDCMRMAEGAIVCRPSEHSRLFSPIIRDAMR